MTKIDPDQPFAMCTTASLTKLKADIACDTERRGRVAVGPTVENVGKSAEVRDFSRLGRRDSGRHRVEAQVDGCPMSPYSTHLRKRAFIRPLLRHAAAVGESPVEKSRTAGRRAGQFRRVDRCSGRALTDRDWCEPAITDSIPVSRRGQCSLDRFRVSRRRHRPRIAVGRGTYRSKPLTPSVNGVTITPRLTGTEPPCSYWYV